MVIGVGIALLSAGVTAALLTRDGAGSATVVELPDSPKQAFAIPTPKPLEVEPTDATVASVRSATVARSRPDRAASAVAPVPARTPEDTTNLVEVLDRAPGPAGEIWIKALLPGYGPGRTVGWIPRGDLGVYQVVGVRLEVDLERQEVALLGGDRELLRVPAGVGTATNPTPHGRFYVRNRLTRFRSPTYGPIAFGTSARSATLTDWPAGGYIGIHGTDRPDLIPGRISHGCIRLRNPDIERLARLLPVGAPVIIR